MKFIDWVIAMQGRAPYWLPPPTVSMVWWWPPGLGECISDSPKTADEIDGAKEKPDE